MHDSRNQDLAKLLVNYSIKLQKGETILLILYGYDGFPLLKEVYRECVRIGAHCTYEIRDSEITRLFFENADDSQINRQPPEYRLQQAHEMDAMVQILADTHSSELVLIDQQKLIAQRKVNKVVSDILHTKRWVLFEYPTQMGAKQAKMPTEQWETFVYQASLVDWQQVAQEQERLKQILEAAKTVRLVAKDTDLTVDISKQHWIKCHGIHNMPDGEIFSSPHREKVNGVITFNTPTQYMGKDFQWIKLRFKDGKVVESDSDNASDLEKILNTDEGARYLGEFAFGTNKFIQQPVKSILFDEKIGGSNHMALGKCYDEAPNGNDSSIHWDLILRHKDADGQVYLDGELIQDKGKWVHPQLTRFNSESEE